VINALFFHTQFTLERFPHYLRLKKLGDDLIRPQIELCLGNQFYEVKTITTTEELLQVLRLRFEVFFREFSTRSPRTFLLYDVDIHDFSCDHLIVKARGNGQVIACYRLLTEEMKERVGRFYTEGEFDLTQFFALPGKKLELGRACVHKDYRKGAVVSLLWKGLCEYAKRSGSQYMFGCSSINRRDFDKVWAMQEALKSKEHFLEDIQIPVQKRYRHTFHFSPSQDDGGRAMGSLMSMYLLAGAKVGKELAYDKEMDCLDLFTCMDMTKLPASFERRFA
jgi:putative hemolysin